MKSFKLFPASILLASSGYANAATYSNTASLSGQPFLNAFWWQTISDPTNGRVKYVDESTAQSDGLYSVSGNTVTLRADDTTVLILTWRFSTSHTCPRDVEHGLLSGLFLLFAFATFTNAVPEVGGNWPNEGEIDIVEGVNNMVPNQSTLHTSASRCCNITSTSTNCDVYSTNNAGCGVKLSDNNSFGPNFNNIGGGWYVVERSDSYIAIYFWERGDSSVPDEVQNPGGSVDTSTWGTPAAYFPNTNCDFSSHFGPMNIIINLDFCGDWAGNVYPSSGCPSNCVDYVNNNPSAFSNAYFEFNSLNIYQ
ncbi:glycoside hydrolase family 16 protein [Chiua virens]|nr:glycoside hydrolase family 16 protein [Chiua virens]